MTCALVSNSFFIRCVVIVSLPSSARVLIGIEATMIFGAGFNRIPLFQGYLV